MSFVKQSIHKLALDRLITFVQKDPQKNLTLVADFLEKHSLLPVHNTYAAIGRKIAANPESNWYQFIVRILYELNPQVLTKILNNLVLNIGYYGQARLSQARENHHDYGYPLAILIDPTTACNLNCKGCWAREYEKNVHLENAVIDRVIREGKELGIYFYLFSGGEPLIRKNDLIRLADKHSDCVFLVFTNGTLVDETFADDLARVANFTLALSIEGNEEATDYRRGKGSYQKLIKSMQLLKARGVPFGFSTCYHSRNWNIVGEPEYLDKMIELGCLYGWYFTYIPLGKHADIDLIATAEQREYMYHRVREARQSKPIYLMDFWNDGEYVNGCIAGGRRYFHINAKGDVEPCAFIHYSDTNIKDVTLVEALQSPLFKQYISHQPFNSNHLRPCPLLDNPDALKQMVQTSGAVSTQSADREDVGELTDKCQEIAKRWAPVADRLWQKSHYIPRTTRNVSRRVVEQADVTY